jgi:AraC-like DNA-binding protein
MEMNTNDGSATPYNKPGPKGDVKWADKVIRGIVVGRNKTIVPPEEVEHFASLGCTDREIAQYFDLSESTLRYNFSDYLTKGRHQLKTTLRQAQLRFALEGNPTLLIWLGKNILQQNDAGTTNDDVRALPWTDDMDDDAIDDDAVELQEPQDADTET